MDKARLFIHTRAGAWSLATWGLHHENRMLRQNSQTQRPGAVASLARKRAGQARPQRSKHWSWPGSGLWGLGMDSDPYGVQAFPSCDQYVLGLDGGSVAKQPDELNVFLKTIKPVN